VWSRSYCLAPSKNFRITAQFVRRRVVKVDCLLYVLIRLLKSGQSTVRLTNRFFTRENRPFKSSTFVGTFPYFNTLISMLRGQHLLLWKPKFFKTTKFWLQQWWPSFILFSSQKDEKNWRISCVYHRLVEANLFTSRSRVRGRSMKPFFWSHLKNIFFLQKSRVKWVSSL
jgi:hypothetical protein